jgi:hypothetical protein
VLLPNPDEKALRSFGLDELHWLDLRHESEAGYARLLQALLEQARADEPVAARGTQAANPFPGALPFDESDATRLFGRSSETIRIAQALDGHPVVVLQGAALVGKTSLVRAGLLPALRDRKAAARLRSTTLIDAWQPAWPELPPSHAPTRDATFDLVIVDHLDSETTTGLDAATRAKRVDGLVEGSHQARKLLLVSRGTEPTLLPAAGTATVLTLAAMDAAALREAIEAPARSTGQLIEPGLVERLIDSAGPARNAVSQLQPVLHLLWEQRRRGWMTNQALDELGHLDGAFAKRARSTLATFGGPTRHWALLLALLRVDASGAWLPRAAVASVGRAWRFAHRPCRSGGAARPARRRGARGPLVGGGPRRRMYRDALVGATRFAAVVRIRRGLRGVDRFPALASSGRADGRGVGRAAR